MTLCRIELCKREVPIGKRQRMGIIMVWRMYIVRRIGWIVVEMMF